ncbi:MAG: triose-phosphate isomerase [Flavobacteriales bacterium]|nr:triose-phosphate isomerase [Flavobacteriales bacterium]
MRKKILVGNWKMNNNLKESTSLVNDILSELPQNGVELVFSPSFVFLHNVVKLCKSYDNVFVAAQDCSEIQNGAYTGDVSAEMIKSCDVNYVILGHSERRNKYAETNYVITQKVNLSLSNNLKVILCCGETLEQREKKVHFNFIKSQISDTLFHLTTDQINNIIIAYEPIWAIGTGLTASKEQAQEMHAFIRKIIAEKFGSIFADNMSILYGGSCKPNNAKELFSQVDIDGGLIGGASLSKQSFIEILNSF